MRQAARHHLLMPTTSSSVIAAPKSALHCSDKTKPPKKTVPTPARLQAWK
nr:MAG TPA: hypothetical protein [Caudoviricetes sp.]